MSGTGGGFALLYARFKVAMLNHWLSLKFLTINIMQDNIKSTYRFVGNIYNEKLHDGYAGAVFLPWGGITCFDNNARRQQATSHNNK